MAEDDDKPVPVQDAQPVESQPQGQPSIVQAQAVQVVTPKQHAAAPVQIPKSYDELLMRRIDRFWDYYNKWGWVFELSPWERRRLIMLGEIILRWVARLDRDRDVGDALIREYTQCRAQHKFGVETARKLLELIPYNLTMLGKTGTQTSMGVDHVAISRLTERFDQMFSDGIEQGPGEVGMRELVAMMQQDVADDYDVTVVVCVRENDRHGGKGSGKSDFAQCLAAMLDPSFTTPARTVFKDDHVRMDKLMHKTKEHGIAWVIDELDKFVNKQETMSAPVRKVASDFVDRRFLNQYVIGCDPQVWYATTKFLNMVTYLIRIVRRGVIEVFLGNERDEANKKWLAPQFGGDGHLIEIPRMPDRARDVYDRCKTYVDHHGPGALDRMLERHPRWPLVPVGSTATAVGASSTTPLMKPFENLPELLSGPVGSTGAEEDASRSSAP